MCRVVEYEGVCRIFTDCILDIPLLFCGREGRIGVPGMCRQGDRRGRQFRVFSCVLCLGANVFLMPNREL